MLLISEIALLWETATDAISLISDSFLKVSAKMPTTAQLQFASPANPSRKLEIDSYHHRKKR
jgi:hypothetical protein